MKLNDGLAASLKYYLPLNKSRLSCLCGMLLSLLRLKQVNLTQLALAFSSEASLPSRYRRLQRFFAEVVFDYDHIAHLIMSLFDFEAQGYYLALDRTNWQWGKTDINFLTLAVVYRGVASLLKAKANCVRLTCFKRNKLNNIPAKQVKRLLFKGK